MGALATLPWDQLGLLIAKPSCRRPRHGFLAGLLGIGGGGILVPVLFETFGVMGVSETLRMHMVLGTSFAIIVPTAYRSFRAHASKGAVDVSVIRRLGPWVIAGVLVGIAIMSSVSSAALKWVWVVMGLGLAIKMAVGRESWRLADDVPASKLVETAAFAIGVISTLMSIGGGMFIVTMLTLLGRPIHAAVATSSGFGPLIAIQARSAISGLDGGMRASRRARSAMSIFWAQLSSFR